MSKRNLFVLVSAGLLLLTTQVLVVASYWGPAASLESVLGSSSELNSPFVDGCPILSRDGQQLYFASTRPGGLGGSDIGVDGRHSTDGPFDGPVNLGAPINSKQCRQ